MVTFNGKAMAMAVMMVLAGVGLSINSTAADARRAQGETMGKGIMQNACRTNDFSEFFEGFTYANWRERQPYIAPTVRVTKAGKTSIVPRQRYRGYDIALIDFNFATASSFAQFDAGKRRNFDRVRHNAVRLRDGSYRVDWNRALYDTSQEEGDGPGRLVRSFGLPGSYMFQRSGACWQLVEDRTGTRAVHR